MHSLAQQLGNYGLDPAMWKYFFYLKFSAVSLAHDGVQHLCASLLCISQCSEIDVTSCKSRSTGGDIIKFDLAEVSVFFLHFLLARVLVHMETLHWIQNFEFPE